jgi:hypothetical protein
MILEKNVKRAIPLDTDFQKHLIAATESTEIEENFPYRQIVGSLMHAGLGTRADIMAAVGIASRYLENPKMIHCDMARQIMHYLRQHPSRPLEFKQMDKPELEVFCDSSYANNEDYSSIELSCQLLSKRP